MKKHILCDHCRGTGAASDGDIHSCSGCGGSGVRITKQQIFPGMFAQGQTTCNECGGRGTVIVKKCPHCKGEKVVEHIQHYTLDIEPGMPEGHDVVFDGEGDESPDWEPGDIILRVRSKKEEGGWRRKESTLYWRETIGIDEVCVMSWLPCKRLLIHVLQALLGFKRNITHLDGHVVEIDRKGVTQPGKSLSSSCFSHSFLTRFAGYVQMFEGEGMPLFEQSGRGNLFIEYNVVLPVELGPDMRQSKTRNYLGEASVTYSFSQQNSGMFSMGLESTRRTSCKTRADAR